MQTHARRINASPESVMCRDAITHHVSGGNRSLIALAMAALLLLGCGLHRQYGPDDDLGSSVDSASLAEIERLRAINAELDSFKAVGSIHLRDPSNAANNMQARVALAGDENRKIRVEVLGMTGQPLASLAYDGRFLYFLEHEKSRIRKQRISDPDLERIVALPVRIKDALSLLKGQVPIDERTKTAAVEHTQNPQTRVLVLWKNAPDGGNDRLWLSANDRRIQRFDRYDRNGRRIFAVYWQTMQERDGFTIPRRLRISAASGVALQMTLSRYWPNATVKSDLFALLPPESDRNQNLQETGGR